MTVTPRVDRPARRRFAPSPWTASGALLLVCAVLTLLQGISALVNDKLLIIGPNYIYQMTITGWGWVHIVIGVLLGIVGFGLIFGAPWSRVAAIVMAGISIIAMFLWLPYYPTWALIVIALDVIVIWGVATWDYADTEY